MQKDLQKVITTINRIHLLATGLFFLHNFVCLKVSRGNILARQTLQNLQNATFCQQCLPVLFVTSGLSGKFYHFQKCWPDSNVMYNDIISQSTIYGQSCDIFENTVLYWLWFWNGTLKNLSSMTGLHGQVNRAWKLLWRWKIFIIFNTDLCTGSLTNTHFFLRWQ